MKQIDASQLRVGMFVMKLGGSWLKHPFWRTQFQLSNQGQIEDIRKAGITEVLSLIHISEPTRRCD